MLRSEFAGWWDLCAANWKTAARMGQSIVAANVVVGSRLEIIHEAWCNPMRGDYAELSRMVSEKFDALAEAGASLARDAQAIHADAVAFAFGGLGNPVQMMERAMAAPGRALMPAHKKVVSNAKRLGRRQRG